MKVIVLFILIGLITACTVVYIRSNNGIEVDKSKKGIIAEKPKEEISC